MGPLNTKTGGHRVPPLQTLEPLGAKLILRQTRNLSYGTHFNGSDARSWNSSRDFNRLVDILCINQEVTTQLLPRFCEGTIGDQAFTVANLNADCFRTRMQRRGT